MKRLFPLALAALLTTVTLSSAALAQGRSWVSGYYRQNGTFVAPYLRTHGIYQDPIIDGHIIYLLRLQIIMNEIERSRWESPKEKERRSEGLEVQRQLANREWNKMMGYPVAEPNTKPAPQLVAAPPQPDAAEKLQAAEEEAELDGLRKPFTGLCFDVADGDTIRVKRDQEIVTVHIYGVDAPELDQPRGEQIKAILKQWVLGEYVDVEPRKIGDDGSFTAKVGLTKTRLARMMARVDKTLGPQLLKYGYAWCLPDTPKLNKYQLLAQQSRLGVWGDADAVSPWLWRRDHQAKP